MGSEPRPIDFFLVANFPKETRKKKMKRARTESPVSEKPICVKEEEEKEEVEAVAPKTLDEANWRLDRIIEELELVMPFFNDRAKKLWRKKNPAQHAEETDYEFFDFNGDLELSRHYCAGPIGRILKKNMGTGEALSLARFVSLIRNEKDEYDMEYRHKQQQQQNAVKAETTAETTEPIVL